MTVFACEAPQITNPWGFSTPTTRASASSGSAPSRIRCATRGNNNTHTMGEMLVAFTPSMARTLAQQGWTREGVQTRLWETARRRLGDIRLKVDGTPAVDAASRYDWWPDWVDQSDPETRVR